jgi:hypothetical protein
MHGILPGEQFGLPTHTAAKGNGSSATGRFFVHTRARGVVSTYEEPDAAKLHARAIDRPTNEALNDKNEMPVDQECFNVMSSSKHHGCFSSQSFWKRGSPRNGSQIGSSLRSAGVTFDGQIQLS